MYYLNESEVIKLHDRAIEQDGGLSGLRDRGLLQSAIEMPKSTMFGQDLHPTIYDKTAAYLFHIAKNHPFNDANKRTSAAAALAFLECNGISIDLDPKEFSKVVEDVASGKLQKNDISNYFECLHNKTNYKDIELNINKQSRNVSHEISSNKKHENTLV